MKNGILTIFFIFVFFHLSAQEDRFLLQGQVSSRFDTRPVFLFTFVWDTIRTVDTTYVRKGQFVFKGEEYMGDQSLVSIGNYPEEVRSAYVILERGVIQLNLGDSVRRLPSGTYLNDQFVAYDDTMKWIEKQWDQAHVEENEAIRQKRLWDITQKRFLIQRDFKRNNSMNLVGEVLFKKGLNNLSDPYFDEIYALMSERIKKSPEVIRYIESRNEKRKRDEDRKRSVGKKYVDFEFETEDRVRHIADYVSQSKILLIDFWASWCTPCKAEIPNLFKVYQKYKDRGLAILSISVDTDRDSWKGALEQYHMPWSQFLVRQADREKLMNAYQFKGIPYMLLLNKEGTIIEVNLRGALLDKYLEMNL